MHIIFTLIISVTNENNRKLPQCGPGRRWQASAEPRDRPLSRAIGGLTALGCIVVWQSEY
ncbi:TPA: hypothetical protein ACNADN_002238 [Klebsiella pneumoniae]